LRDSAIGSGHIGPGDSAPISGKDGSYYLSFRNRSSFEGVVSGAPNRPTLNVDTASLHIFGAPAACAFTQFKGLAVLNKSSWR
jgi:hypothetical protein